MAATRTNPLPAEGTRVIVHRADATRQWSAWFVDQPHETAAAPNAADAVWQLLKNWGVDLGTAHILPDRDKCSSELGHFEMLDLPHKIPCPDCKGSGTYVGLSVVESCRRCGGNKTIARSAL
jgi:hypothetical protein